MSGFRVPHEMGTSATGCKLCRVPLPEFSNVVYFVYGLFVVGVTFMVLTSIQCLWTKGICSTGYTEKNGAVSKVNKKFISHPTRAQRTPSAAATIQVSHAVVTILQCVHPGSHNTHPHGNQIHPRLGVACPL